MIKIVTYLNNQGKGYAVNQGILAAKGELILFCDADNATPFEQIDRLIRETELYEVVIGSRHLKGSQIQLKQNWLRRTLARFGNLLIQVMLLPGFPDTQCGFKLFKRSAAKAIIQKQTIWRWGFDIELLYIAKKLGYRMKQVPVDWYDRQGSKIQSPRVFLTTLGELFKIKWRSWRGRYR